MAGVRRFQQAKYLKALPRVRPGESLGWMRRIGQVDQMVKTGQEAAAWEELLTLILAASGAALRPARTCMMLQSRSVPNPRSRPTGRPEQGRGGKEWVSQVSSVWAPYH